MPAPALPAPASRLLDSFPLIRSRSADEARQRVGDVFSPHRLELRGDSRGLDVRHNRVALGQSAINVLHYGAEVEIDPGERGDFYLVQLPLSGHAQVRSGGDGDGNAETPPVQPGTEAAEEPRQGQGHAVQGP